MRDSAVNRLLGLSLRDSLTGVQGSLERIECQNLELREQYSALRNEYSAFEERLAFQDRRIRAQLEQAKQERDNIPSLKAQLEAARQTAEYGAVFREKEPLVTVRIPAFKKTTELMDVAIASVLKQTYDRFEIIVVNDGPNESTRKAIEGLNESRIRYVEFPEQNKYPDDPHLRWMVAGSPGMNLGAEMAQGSWIAPLDDDDEFTADHVEKLLALALDQEAELAYGALTQKHLTHGTENRIWSYPPAISQFSFMGAIYMKPLNFFRYDQQSWIVDEPGDWNLIRRMTLAGVRMAATEDIVGTMYSVSYTHKS